MNQILKGYKENLPVLLLFVYGFGSIYLVSYYNQFNIAIEQYINLTDILFFSLKVIVLTSLGFIILEMLILLIGIIIAGNIAEGKYKSALSRKANRTFSKESEKRYIRVHVDKYLGKKFQTIASKACFIIWLALILVIKLGYKFDISLSDFLSISFPYLLFREYIEKNSATTDLSKMKKNQLKYATIIICIVLIILPINAKDKADLIKANTYHDDVSIKAIIDNRPFGTSNTLVFVGSTSSYMFFFDLTLKETLIHPRSDIHDLRFKD